MYLTDEEVLNVMTKCANILTTDENGESGQIYVKENITGTKAY